MSTIVKIIIGFAVLGLIALIGIFVSMYLVSSGGAREAAKDARITATMDQLRSKAELITSEEEGYSKFACDYDSETQTLCKDVEEQGGEVTVWSGEDNYCAYTPLNEGDYYCIDSAGLSGKVSNPSGICKEGNYECPELNF